MTNAAAWMPSSPPFRRCCARLASGHMGATPQPKPTVVSRGNQRRRSRNSGKSNLSESNQRSRESIDTVGVTGSIPVSPTKTPELLASSAPGTYFVPEVSTEPQVLCSRPILILSWHAGTL